MKEHKQSVLNVDDVLAFVLFIFSILIEMSVFTICSTSLLDEIANNP